MLITNTQKTINVGGNRTEQRILMFDVGLKNEGYIGSDLMAQFPVKIYKELTASEALLYNGAGLEVLAMGDGRVFTLINSRNAMYKKTTLDVVVGNTLYKDFENVKYMLMKAEIDRVTQLFDSWDVIEQIKVGDYYGVTAAELDFYTGLAVA